MPLFGGGGPTLSYEISAEDKSKSAIDSAKSGLGSLDQALSDVAKNTADTGKATAELSQTIKGLGDSSGREFKTFADNSESHFGQVAAAIARVGVAVVTFRTAAGAAFAFAGQAIAGIGAAIASANLARGFIETAEAAKRTEAQLKLVTGTGKEFEAVQQAIYKSSQDLGQPLIQSIELYAGVGRGLKQAGYEYKQVLELTNNIGLALKASGTDSVSAAHGIRQLTQALGAGALRGDEFTSVLENVPRLAQAIADGLGQPIGKLRGLAEQGKLTTEVIVEALESQTERLRAEAEKIPLSIEQATTKLQSSISLYVADIDFAIGATSKLAGAVDLLASAFTRTEDPLKAAVERIREVTTEFDTFKSSVGDVSFLNPFGAAAERFGTFFDDISAKIRLAKELLGTLTAPGNIVTRVAELAEGTPEEKQLNNGLDHTKDLIALESRAWEQLDQRRRGNQVPGASRAAPRFTSISDDSVAREAQNRLENIDKIDKAEEVTYKKSIARVSHIEKAHEDSYKKRAEAENRLSDIQNKGLDHTEDLIALESRAWEELDQGRAQAINERVRLEERAAEERADTLREHEEENRRLVEQPFLNAIDGIQGGFTDAFRSIFSGGVDTFGDLANTVKNIFINLAAEIASLALFQTVAGAFGLGGGGGGGLAGAAGSLLGGGGGAGGGGGGFLSSAGSLLSGGSSASSLFGGPSLTSGFTGAINSFGASTGLFGGAALPAGAAGPTYVGSLTGATLSSVLGAAGAGAGIGGVISSLLGGNTTVGTVAGGFGGVAGGLAGGALAGAAAGSVVPVIGTIIGAIIGGLIGGAIKETPPRGFQTTSVGSGTIAQGGKKGFDPETFTPISGGISSAILTVGKDLGIDSKRLKAIEFWIGYNEGSGFRTTVTGKGDIDFGKDAKSIEKIQTTIFQQELRGFAERSDKFTRKVLNEAFDEKSLLRAVNTVHAYVALKKEIEKATRSEPDRVGERVLSRALDKGGVKSAAKSADVDIAFIKEFQDATKSGLGGRDELRRLFKTEIKDLEREFNRLSGRAKELGLSVSNLNKIEKRRISDLLSSRLFSTVASIQALREQTGITGVMDFIKSQKTSEFLAPQERLSAARAEFDRISTAARGGDLEAARALPQAAQDLLSIGRDVLASGPEFAKLFADVNSEFLKLQEKQLQRFKFPDIESAIRDVSKLQVTAIREQSKLLAEELTLIRREIRRRA